MEAETFFSPTLTTTDWNAEWQRLQQARRAADDASYWDKRSETFGNACGALAHNPYVERFIELAGVREGESVFDMGCGTGALAIPYAHAGHDVIAADFSAGMLGVTAREAAELGLSTLRTAQMSWEDDWAAHGVTPGCADVAVASRSIATADMRDSLLRLTDVARRRCCVTLATGCSPRSDERILHELGLQAEIGRDYLYAFNILANEGIKAEVNYISSAKPDTYATREEARESLRRMVLDACGTMRPQAEVDAALNRLDEWMEENVLENEHAGEADGKGRPQGAWRLREPRIITWSFLAWNK